MTTSAPRWRPPRPDGGLTMTAPPPTTRDDADSWARPVDRLVATGTGASVDTVTGRRVAGPIQGFGQMWQKTFAVRLEGVDITPEHLVAHWRDRFPTFWPKGATLLCATVGHPARRGCPTRGVLGAGLTSQDVDWGHGHLRRPRSLHLHDAGRPRALGLDHVLGVPRRRHHHCSGPGPRAHGRSIRRTRVRPGRQSPKRAVLGGRR